LLGLVIVGALWPPAWRGATRAAPHRSPDGRHKSPGGRGSRGADRACRRDSELGRLARSFDEMAEAVEQRTAERARAAAELVRSERIGRTRAARGRVAHELRNPLSVIAGRIEILKLQMAPGQAPTSTFSLVASLSSRRPRSGCGGSWRASRRIPAGQAGPHAARSGRLLRATSEVLAYEARKHEVSISVQVPPMLLSSRRPKRAHASPRQSRPECGAGHGGHWWWAR